MWLSLFKSVVEPDLLKAAEVDWAEMITKLEGHRHRPVFPITKEAKRKSMPCWSPVRLKDGRKRSTSAAVEEVWALALDFDGDAKSGRWPSIEELLDLWGDWACWIHTTTGHTPEAPRCRVVVQVSRAMTPTEFKGVWAWAEQRCLAAGIVLDKQCKDPRRLWLFPYPHRGTYESWVVDGAPLDVAMVLSKAMEAEAAGHPVHATTNLEDGFVFWTNEGPLDPTAWAKTVKVGDAVKGYCPHVPKEKWNSTSAWMRRRASGVYVGCKSASHSHDGDLAMWFPNPDANAGKPKADRSLFSQLDWKVDKQGNRTGLESSKHNLMTILRGDPRVNDRLWFDAFSEVVMVDDLGCDDTVVFGLQTWVERAYGIKTVPTDFWNAMQIVAKEKPRNPLIEHLDSLEWDGEERLDTWVVTVTNCDDTPLNRKLGAKWLMQAIARAYEPGCKADYVLVFKGEQGTRKSTMLRVLAGGHRWYSNAELNFEHRSVYDVISKAWIFELGELASVRRSAVESTKNFITTMEDLFTPMYGRLPIVRKRKCVFAATTNAPHFLIDETGNRRFWPVEDREINLEWLIENRDQLMAEAIVRYRSGEKRYLDKDDEKLLKLVQEEYQEEHPWAQPVHRWLDRTTRVTITTGEVLTDALESPPGKMQPDAAQRAAIRVGTILRRAGWLPYQFSVRGVRERFYVRPGFTQEQARDELDQMRGG